jgi:hypothetical protein
MSLNGGGALSSAVPTIISLIEEALRIICPYRFNFTHRLERWAFKKS